MPLTETRLRALKTKDKPYKVADQRGLYVEVTPAGGKHWRFRYRIGKLEKKLVIGSYPEVSLKEARDATYEARQTVAAGEDSSFAKRSDGSIEVETEDGPIRFDTMIDARGQSPSKLEQLPFPSLVANIGDRDAVLLRPFELGVNGLDAGRVFCLALPQLLERHPFAQGLVECHELASIAVEEITRHADK